MKGLAALLIAFFFVSHCIAQNRFDSHLLSVTPTDILMGTKEPLLSKNNNDLYALDVNVVNKCISLIQYKIKKDLLELNNSSIIKLGKYDRREVKQFVVKDNLLLVLFFKSLVIFKKEGKYYKISKTYDNIDYSGILGTDNGEFHLYSYYSYMEGVEDKIKLQNIEFENNSIKFGVSYERSAPLISFTPLVHRFIDVNSKGRIVYCETSPYNIKSVVDRDSDITLLHSDTLCNIPVEALKAIMESAKEKNIKTLIEKIHSYDTVMTRIQKILYLNDSLLLITRLSPSLKAEVLYLDIWKVSGQQQPIPISIGTQYRSLYTEKDANEIFHPRACLNCTGSMTIIGNYIISTELYLPAEILNTQNISVMQMSKKADGYYRDKQPIRGIYLYKYELHK